MELIKPNELRVGNWVAYGDKYYQIEEILKRNDNYAICFKDLYHGVWIEHVKPIPLTEDKFINCGFKKHKKHDWVYNFGDYEGVQLVQSKRYGLGYYMNEACIAFPKYIHDLQNIFFSLHKAELEVSLC